MIARTARTAQHQEEARLFLQELAEKPPELPYETRLLPQLFSITREGSTSSTGDLTSLIERSQKLASKVLALANSALYALESTVTSLQWAVSLLGFHEVRTLVVMVGAAEAIKGARLPREFDAVGLWRHQLETARIARAMASILYGDTAAADPAKKLSITPDEAYVSGLLHDIGKVVLASARPNVWRRIEVTRARYGLSFTEAEDAYWGMDHSVIGAQVLHHWKLPRLLTDPINWHHAPHLVPVFKLETRLLAAADHVAHQGVGDDGALPESAAALLPPKSDQLAVGLAVKEALAKGGLDTLMGLAV